MLRDKQANNIPYDVKDNRDAINTSIYLLLKDLHRQYQEHHY